MAEGDRAKALRDAVQDAHLKALGIQVVLMRRQRGWSQKDLAKRAGVSWQLISRIENEGAEGGSLATLEAIAHAFDVSLTAGFVPWSAMVGIPADYAHDARAHPQPNPDGVGVVAEPTEEAGNGGLR